MPRRRPVGVIRDPDVLIVGAGPAGAASAIALSRFGFSVCVVDRARFPRPQIGESLPAGMFPLLHHLGVGDAVAEAGFATVRQVNIAWAGERSERRAPPGMAGLNVDRSVFDTLLLHAAVEAGAHTRLGVRVGAPTRQCNGERWDVVVQDGALRHRLAPRFIVDASGRRGLMGSGKQLLGSPQLALYAYWQLPHNDGRSGSCVETGADDWRWWCRLSKRRAVAALFVDPALMTTRGKQALERLYLERWRQKDGLTTVAHGAMAGPIMACNASVVQTSTPVTDGLIRVGDACFAHDPLSSQGVQAAIAMALQAAAVINTLLKYPERRAIAEMFYRDRLKHKVEKHLEQLKRHYQTASEYYQTPFWARRAELPVDQPITATDHPTVQIDETLTLALANQASVVTAAVIRDGLIQHEPALWRPGLAEPVAMAGALPVAALLPVLAARNSVGTLAGALRAFGNPAQIINGLGALVNQGLLAVCEDGAGR